VQFIKMIMNGIYNQIKALRVKGLRFDSES